MRFVSRENDRWCKGKRCRRVPSLPFMTRPVEQPTRPITSRTVFLPALKIALFAWNVASAAPRSDYFLVNCTCLYHILTSHGSASFFFDLIKFTLLVVQYYYYHYHYFIIFIIQTCFAILYPGNKAYVDLLDMTDSLVLTVRISHNTTLTDKSTSVSPRERKNLSLCMCLWLRRIRFHGQIKIAILVLALVLASLVKTRF